eukprot:295148-Chlamydomonas_euryale.AAC.4
MHATATAEERVLKGCEGWDVGEASPVLPHGYLLRRVGVRTGQPLRAATRPHRGAGLEQYGLRAKRGGMDRSAAATAVMVGRKKSTPEQEPEA